MVFKYFFLSLIALLLSISEIHTSQALVTTSQQNCVNIPGLTNNSTGRRCCFLSDVFSTSLSKGGYHCFPSFLIIGTQKSGTTALCGYLSYHSQIQWPVLGEKEIHYFDKKEKKGTTYYVGLFPSLPGPVMAEFLLNNVSNEDISNLPSIEKRKRKREIKKLMEMKDEKDFNSKDFIVSEATPAYIADQKACNYISQLIPETKLIVMVRDPIERAYSEYQMKQRRVNTQNRYLNLLNENNNPMVLYDCMVQVFYAKNYTKEMIEEKSDTYYRSSMKHSFSHCLPQEFILNPKTVSLYRNIEDYLTTAPFPGLRTFIKKSLDCFIDKRTNKKPNQDVLKSFFQYYKKRIQNIELSTKLIYDPKLLETILHQLSYDLLDIDYLEFNHELCFEDGMKENIKPLNKIFLDEANKISQCLLNDTQTLNNTVDSNHQFNNNTRDLLNQQIELTLYNFTNDFEVTETYDITTTIFELYNKFDSCFTVKAGISSLYLYRSLYAIQYGRCLNYLQDQNQYLFIETNELKQNPNQVLNIVQKHLEVEEEVLAESITTSELKERIRLSFPGFEERTGWEFQSKYLECPENIYKGLKLFFKSFNEILYQMINKRYNWNS